MRSTTSVSEQGGSLPEQAAAAQEPAAPAQIPSLDALHDIVVPEPVSWMPATTAWNVLFGLLVVALIAITWLAWRRHRANRYRRAALARMDEVEAALADRDRRSAALQRLPVIVKQVALAISPRSDVASLSGQPWLAYLDGTYQGDRFRDGPGRLLPGIAYARPEALAQIPDDEVRQLTALLRDWICKHRRGAAPRGAMRATKKERHE
jgi:hypothetical protein